MDTNTTSNIGLIGLGVMGSNLALNLSDKGYSLSVYNRTYSLTQQFMGEQAQGRAIQSAATLPEFVSQLGQPAHYPADGHRRPCSGCSDRATAAAA